MRFLGFIDTCNQTCVEGWVWDRHYPDRSVTVTVLNDGVSIGQTLANEYRADLEAAGIGSGRHGYRYSFPKPILVPDRISVVISESQTELARSSSSSIRSSASADTGRGRSSTGSPNVASFKTLPTGLISRGLWCIDEAYFDGSTFLFNGWGLRPPFVPARLCSFFVNGRPCKCELQCPRADLGRLFWYVPNAASSGFYCSADLTPEDGGVLELAFGSTIHKKPFREEFNYYFTLDSLPLPDAPRRARVHGSENELTYRLEGFSAYRKLDKALRKIGRSFDDFSRILDWGCGSGRVTRYFVRNLDSHVSGVDIDADNIEWCRRNLPFGSFQVIPLHPPKESPAETFDLVLGISVFTHLREDVMREWLEWLARILDPGGIALITVMGEHAWARSPSLPEEDYHSWKEKGILDTFDNLDLKGVLSPRDSNYYRNTFISEQYIGDQWSQYLDIVDMIPGYIGSHQDLLVLSPRHGGSVKPR